MSEESETTAQQGDDTGALSLGECDLCEEREAIETAPAAHPTEDRQVLAAVCDRCLAMMERHRDGEEVDWSAVPNLEVSEGE
jgi:hypothetical protein